jgi:hypothetical protein
MQAARSSNVVGIQPAIPFTRIDSNEAIDNFPVSARAIHAMNMHQILDLAASIGLQLPPQSTLFDKRRALQNFIGYP